MMRKRYWEVLGRDVSVLALGTQAFGTSITLEDSFKMLDLYTELGGNFLDTARLYGYYGENIQGISEAVLGHWMRARKCRDSVILGTKGAHPRLGHMTEGRLDPASIRWDIESSLRALQTDHVDIYWLHRDDVSRSAAEIMETLNALVREGKTLALGASNWTTARIAEANAYAAAHGLQGFCASQPQWSLARQEILDDPTLVRMDAESYAWYRGSGLAVVPFTSQAKGFYYKLAEGGEASLSRKARDRFLSARNLRTFEALKQISSRTGYGPGALSIAYLTSQPFPVFPIVGFSTLEQAGAMHEAGEILLSGEDIALLNGTSEIG